MKLRRSTSAEPRLEITPLIDVVFLLLTFFVFALVLLVRAEVLDVSLPQLTAGEEAANAQLVTVAIDREGAVFVEGEPVEIAGLAEAVADVREARPEARLVIAVDEEARSGATLAVVDALVARGITEFAVLGAVSGQDPMNTPAAPDE